MPPDKAVQIARQLCAGIAAAHEKGVLHRDLKPANVMLDGNGDVRIADFGIATLGEVEGDGVAGTPQYMAPELLAGRPGTTKSDIFALGLILFEVFTGKRAYEAKTLADLKQLHDTATLTTPSSIVSDLDPAVERVILRCLEKDPEKRPASALTVAAALPGGDPLAAALAAGETPSPELLVAAGESVAVPVAPALAMLAGFFLVLVLGVVAGSRGSVISQLPMAIPRDALADRANQILKKLGHGSGSRRSCDGVPLRRRLHPMGTTERSAGMVDRPSDRPSGRVDLLVSNQPGTARAVVPGQPRERARPSDDAPGDAATVSRYRRAPRRVSCGAAGDRPGECGAPTLRGRRCSRPRISTPETFTPASPKWLPPVFADATAAWEGPMPGRADMRVRIEAASYRNHPVSFQIVWPWTEPPRTDASQRTGLQRLTDATSIAIWVAMLAGAVLLARRNLRANRSDRRGAARLAIGDDGSLQSRSICWRPRTWRIRASRECRLPARSRLARSPAG